MLQLRPNCECCNTDLAGDAADAYICSFECTFCARCTGEKLQGKCPNCGGELVRRPPRAADKLMNIRHPRSGFTSPKAAVIALPETALISRVPEAERYIAHHRQRFDPSARRNVPAHVTILYPFMAPALVDDEVIAASRASRVPFRVSTTASRGRERFPVALYLAPDPGEPFSALIAGIFRAFPDYPPFEGNSTPSSRMSPSRMATSRCSARSRSSCASRCRDRVCRRVAPNWCSSKIRAAAGNRCTFSRSAASRVRQRPAANPAGSASSAHVIHFAHDPETRQRQIPLYSRKLDRKTGRRRNLGTFGTRAAAERHERAVQYFKRH